MISDIIVKYAFWNTRGSSGDVKEGIQISVKQTWDSFV